MTTRKPFCYQCPNFLSPPTEIGGKAKCKAYTNGIPKNIFFNGAPCSRLSDKMKSSLISDYYKKMLKR